MGVESGCDEAVLGEYRKIESEEFAKCFETIKADVGSEHGGHDTDDEKGSDLEVALRGTDEGVYEGGGRRHWKERSEIEQHLKCRAYPYNRLVHLHL